MTANVKALLSGFEFKKQKFMTKEQIRIEAEAYNKSLKRHPSSEQALTEVLVEFAERLQNLQQCNVSGALPPFPDWNEAIKGIDDSRFTTLDGRYEVREGARIMYDRLYSMLTRRQ